MTYTHILAEQDAGVATITIARPDKLNALLSGVFEEMSAAIDAALADGARAIVLTGQGRAFCSGADLGTGAEGLPDDLGALLDNPGHGTLSGQESGRPWSAATRPS